MTRADKKRRNGSARPIKTQRDYERASTLVKRLSGQTSPDSTAELRLQSLLRELDKFDDPDDDMSDNDPEDQNYSGPHRRWSDDGPGDD